MKDFFALLCMIAPCYLQGQHVMHSVQVEASWQGDAVRVSQTISFEWAAPPDTLWLKALRFEESAVSDFEIQGVGQWDIARIEKAELLQLLAIATPSAGSEVTLTYHVISSMQRITIPLFFADFAAKDSRGDFFTMTVEPNTAGDLFLHFPSTPSRAQQPNGSLAFELPALPAMVRFEVIKNGRLPLTTLIIDGSVVCIFLIIGVIIWIKRKTLVHG